MKNIVVLVLMFAGSATIVHAQMNTKAVLLIAQETSFDMELMLSKEVKPIVDLVKKAGYRIVIASGSGKVISGISSSITPDIRLSDVNPSQYAGIIVPCMAVEEHNPIIRNIEIEIIRKAIAQKIPIAVQKAAVELVAHAEGLDGKQFAAQQEDVSSSGIYNSDDEMYDLAPTAIYKGTGVVRDGLIVTSGTCPYMAKDRNLPDGTVEMTKQFIDILSLANSK